MKKTNQVNGFLTRSRLLLHQFPYFFAVSAILLYLLSFQFNFLFTGDAWAESFAEYLDESVRLGWEEVIAQNWAGYFSLIPSFIAKAYVALGMPLGYIDIFYKIVVVGFVAFTASLFALKFNRTIIASDILRIFLSVATVVILFDIASFSFINIWYLPLLPLIFIYLSPKKISTKADVALGILGALVSLTKPFLIIAPIIVLRALRSKQWLGPLIFFLGTAIQTYQIIFNDRRQLVENAHISLTDTIGSIISGSGVSLLKLVDIFPVSVWVVILADAVLLAIFVLLWRTRGIWTALILGSVYLFSVYTYVLAPDFPAYTGFYDFQELFGFDYKTQREILINGSLIISLLLLIDSYVTRLKKEKKPIARYLPLALPLILLVIIYKPIETINAGVSTKPIEAFRQDLNNNLPTCVPLSPTPVFIYGTNWSYSHKTLCNTPTHDVNIFKPDFKSMNIDPNKASFNFNALYFRLADKELSAVVVPVDNKSGTANTLFLYDDQGKQYKSRVEPRKGIQFIAFNTRGSDKRVDYQLRFSAEHSGISLGKFSGTPNPIVYLYFLD